MRLPLDRARYAALFAMLDELDRLGVPAVLVGGLVPPLLLEHLDPDGAALAPEARRTSDCDIIVHVPLHYAGERYELVLTFLRSHWTRKPAVNQFRWEHASGLRLDLIPVPVGIEDQAPDAVAFVTHYIPDIEISTFYRGQELAITTAVVVDLEDQTGGRRRMRIAALVPMLVMKLRAWEDSNRGRKRDAHDIAWLLRYLDAAIVVDALRFARTDHATLVDRIVRDLRAEFTDPWHAGITHYVIEAFPERYRNPDDDAESERYAAAQAIQRVLEALDRTA